MKKNIQNKVSPTLHTIQKVLETIEKHKLPITAGEINKQSKVDWRSLNVALSYLIDEGKVQRIQMKRRMFYGKPGVF